ncbi:oxidoreductase [Virgisporangium aliadipatigenens]|uniref:Oxidoreductase n=1 Tax=Virgisporangium aliadipatigenens TaxID=741659 RepID=A0A8J4DRX7_9ACTN|nr:oxidoreductase [Virgisporangium aliadipatigenens]GIJ48144.1 oxidoreductase [Virgisporangium aliadipatigenens]
MATEPARPSLAVWKFASCDGCQLTLLDCGDALLTLAARLHIAAFPEASSMIEPGPYDVSLVEGSITTEEDAARIRDIRARSTLLVAIGACATAGGIQALRDLADVDEFRAQVYPHPEYVRSLATATPISAHVPVDLELHGCPIDRGQLVEVLGALLAGRKPDLPVHSVCAQCKARGTPCLPVVAGVPCLGPVTRAGCGALCPAYGRGCFGCFGPVERPNTRALVALLRHQGMSPADIGRVFRTYTATTAQFRAAAEEGARS